MGAAAGESSVGCLPEPEGAAPAAVSQHRALLRLAGLVKGRGEGTFVHYSAADDDVKALLDQALFRADHLDRDFPHSAVTPTPVGSPGVVDQKLA